jgi:hypothetical protein
MAPRKRTDPKTVALISNKRRTEYRACARNLVEQTSLHQDGTATAKGKQVSEPFLQSQRTSATCPQLDPTNVSGRMS